MAIPDVRETSTSLEEAVPQNEETFKKICVDLSRGSTVTIPSVQQL